MFYPTVTERQVRMEPIGHDTFIEDLGRSAAPPEAAPTPEQRQRRLAVRRRMHLDRSQRRIHARLT